MAYWSRYLVLSLIKLYQNTLSCDHGLMRFFYPGGFCRYQPTCSDYAYQSVERYGIIKGGRLAIWRIIRCHPGAKGGYDPIP